MTFLEWANARKWYDWTFTVCWFITGSIFISAGATSLAMTQFMMGVVITFSDYTTAKWKHIADHFMMISTEQLEILHDVMKHLPQEERQKVAAKVLKLSELVK